MYKHKDLTAYEDKINSLVDYVNRVDITCDRDKVKDSIVTMCNNSDSFIEDTFTNENMESFDKLTKFLSKYMSKLKMVGKKPFGFEIDNIMNKLVFVLTYINNGSLGSNYYASLVEYVSNIDKIEFEDRIRERIIFKAPAMLSLQYIITNYTGERDIDILDEFYKGNKLMYISPLEYYYTFQKLCNSVNGLVGYVSNVLWLFLCEVHNTNFDMNRVIELRKDLDVKFKDMLEYEKYALNKLKGDNRLFGGSHSRTTVVGYDLFSILELKMIVDIVNDDRLLNIFKNAFCYNGDNSEFTRNCWRQYSDIVNMMNRFLSEKLYYKFINVIDKRVIQYSNTKPVIATYINNKVDFNDMVELYGLMNNGVPILSFDTDKNNFDTIFSDRYSSLIDMMIENAEQ